MGTNDSFLLTVSPNLFQDWDWENALSEVMQNGIDEHRKTSYPFKVVHNPSKKTLSISNEFAVLKRDALITGFTTKKGDDSMIGEFGVGLPGALSTFARLDVKVEIYTNEEIWKPSVIREESFNYAELTKINVRNRREGRKVKFEGVEVIIYDVTEEMWEKSKKRFLFLDATYPKISTSFGEILTHPDQVGRIYGKGVYVTQERFTGFGYNLYNLTLDMGRKVINHYMVREEAGSALREALLNNPGLVIDTVWSKLISKDVEVSNVIPNPWDSNYKTVQEIFVKKFIEQNGEDTIPVQSISESMEIGHLAKKGVIVQDIDLRDMLQSKLGSAKSLKEAYNNSWSKIYNLHELTQEELSNFRIAIDLITKAIAPSKLGNTIHIVDFNNKGLQGLHSSEAIYISKDTLNNLTNSDLKFGVLNVLVHEYSHNFGQDGDVEHVRAIERTWGSIVRSLLN
jgi:hypothetical protein